jgi:hypothetical protein
MATISGTLTLSLSNSANLGDLFLEARNHHLNAPIQEIQIKNHTKLSTIGDTIPRFMEMRRDRDLERLDGRDRGGKEREGKDEEDLRCLFSHC